MLLSRKWLHDEFVSVEASDRDFAEAMTISGSKVEAITNMRNQYQNICVGKILKIVRHPESDHMFLVSTDVGLENPIQIVTGAWNIHEGDLVPVAMDGAVLPGGKVIRNEFLRGELSQGMFCSLKELDMDTHDFAYATITPAAILNDYHPLKSGKPSISPNIKAGDTVFGSVICAEILELQRTGTHSFAVRLTVDGKGTSKTVSSSFDNLHVGDKVALSGEEILGLDALHAQQSEFPHCIADGIFILDEEDAVPGKDIREILGKNDTVIDFEITPNRPDCLCMIGLAREAAVTFHKPLHLHKPEIRHSGEGRIGDYAKVFDEEPELCRRYTAKMVRNVKIGPSPRWMRERIRACGMRPINNIVDITNYVMMEYGQPMHAFDFSCVKGGEIHIRLAKPGETIQTLDGNDRSLTENMLCICDVEKPVGVAGVMGGANSEIVGDTAMVLFESANFEGTSIRRTATALGMRTDASSRYEKGLDLENTVGAVERACELVEMLGCGEVIDGMIDVCPKHEPQRRVKLEVEKINALLGTDLDRSFMENVLKELGFGQEGDEILVPSWRSDVEHYSDLAEEVARFYGYNNIPVKFSNGNTSCGRYTEKQKMRSRIGAACRSLGMDEIITFSFISASYYDKIRLPADSPLRDSMKILNPLGEDSSIMRTTLLPSMLDILVKNYNNRNMSAKMYEIGKAYFKREDGLADEPEFLSLGAYGDEMNFFLFKGYIEYLIESERICGVRYVAETDNPSYHPGRCAAMYLDGERIGVFGQVDPRVMRNYGIEAEFYCAEISFEALYAHRAPKPEYVPLPRYPSVERDLSIVCAKTIPVAELESTIRKAGGENLVKCDFFDVYTGIGIPVDARSVSFSLSMRSDDHTMTDEEADAIIRSVLTALEAEYKAVLR
jgi:phenylalanyl-tRNA synthetase beta chain